MGRGESHQMPDMIIDITIRWRMWIVKQCERQFSINYWNVNTHLLRPQFLMESIELPNKSSKVHWGNDHPSSCCFHWWSQWWLTFGRRRRRRCITKKSETAPYISTINHQMSLCRCPFTMMANGKTCNIHWNLRLRYHTIPWPSTIIWSDSI